MSDIRSEREQRVHVALDANDIANIDDYRFTAGIDSRSEAVRRLVGYAVKGELPPNHSQVLTFMAEEKRTREKNPALRRNAEATTSDRLHIIFKQCELERIDEYRFAARLESRSEAIRQLFWFALDSNFSRDHLETLQKIKSRRQALGRHLSIPQPS